MALDLTKLPQASAAFDLATFGFAPFSAFSWDFGFGFPLADKPAEEEKPAEAPAKPAEEEKEAKLPEFPFDKTLFAFG